MKKLFTYVVLSISLFASVVYADASSALPEVKDTISKVVAVAEQHAGVENATVRREKLREIIAARFDFSEMAKRSLGANWLKLTPEQQKDFVAVFSELLSKTYMGRVEEAKSNMITVDSEQLEFPRSVVKTKVSHDGQVFPIDYKLYSQDGVWKVYDVIIENIGLIANYRNEFAGTIRSEGIEGLLQKLHTKVKQ